MQLINEMTINTIEPEKNDNDENAMRDVQDLENYNDAEFQAINAQLDQLNSALDSLERRNDDIHAELVELLKSNVDIRKQFQESREKHVSNVRE